jgi:hypothetical protein
VQNDDPTQVVLENVAFKPMDDLVINDPEYISNGPFLPEPLSNPSPNFLAYTQYYVAIACLCVNPSKKTWASSSETCAQRSTAIVDRDFTFTARDPSFSYKSYIGQSNHYEVVMDNDSARLVKRGDVSDETGKDVLALSLTDIRTDRFCHTLLIFLYYAMAYVLGDATPDVSNTINTDNLVLLVRCWRGDQGLKSPTLDPSAPGQSPSIASMVHGEKRDRIIPEADVDAEEHTGAEEHTVTPGDPDPSSSPIATVVTNYKEHDPTDETNHIPAVSLTSGGRGRGRGGGRGKGKGRSGGGERACR